MKNGSTIAKIIAAIICAAGVVFLVATYGDKLVAFAKKLLPGKKEEEVIDAEATEEEPAEEAAEAAAEEVVEEATEEAPEATEETPVAEEADFVG